jgi:hypothetical protein
LSAASPHGVAVLIAWRYARVPAATAVAEVEAA